MRCLPIAILVAALLVLASSCYVTQQGSRYLALRSRAVPVARALADPRLLPATRALLDRASAARVFAVAELGLKETKSYQSIVELDSDRLATVVSACDELSFKRFLWSYPLVGKLPYRGYFDPKLAEIEAARLRKLGLDVIARPVDAFSTLGWLADPLFSFMASYDEADVAELVIHEMTHATIFLKGKRPGAEQFNEELATFVGREGSALYLARKYGPDSAALAGATRSRADAQAFAAWLRGTATELEAVYSSEAAPEEKRRRKAEVIAARAVAYKAAYDGLFATDRYRDFPMERINNAYLDLYRLYEGEPELYADYYDKVCGRDMRRFIKAMSRIAEGRGDPKEAMRRELGEAGGR